MSHNKMASHERYGCLKLVVFNICVSRRIPSFHWSIRSHKRRCIIEMQCVFLLRIYYMYRANCITVIKEFISPKLNYGILFIIKRVTQAEESTEVQTCVRMCMCVRVPLLKPYAALQMMECGQQAFGDVWNKCDARVLNVALVKGRFFFVVIRGDLKKYSVTRCSGFCVNLYVGK